LIEITGKVNALLETRGLSEGLCTVFVRHTSASLLIQENADPDVLIDLEHWLVRWVEDGDPAFRHRLEGPDDMAAHIRSALTQTSIGIPFSEGRLALGTWQGLYLWEHRYSAHERQVLVHLSAV
jgi:secondary thiamine-phosphate synthase enzyme